MLVLPGTLPWAHSHQLGEAMTLDDFVFLGKTVPEPNSDGRVFVCSAGWSRELRSLVRIYPLSRFLAPKTWSVCTVRLQRNPRDSRNESFQLFGDRHDGHAEINHECITAHSDVKPASLADELRKRMCPSIRQANDRRLSLALVRPKNPEVHFEYNPDSPASPQLALFDAPQNMPEFGSKRFAYIPRIHFWDEDGEHDLQLREWGCYEFLRKQGEENRHKLNPHLSADSTLLVGNLNNHRTAWVVISVLNGLAPTKQRALFGDFELTQETT